MHGPFLSDVVVSDSDLCETLSQAPAFGIVCKFGGLVFLIHLHLQREGEENKSLIFRLNVEMTGPMRGARRGCLVVD